MTTTSWRVRDSRSPLADAWLLRRMAVAYALCPVVIAVIVAVGRSHRLGAAVLMVTAFVGTHVYVAVCSLLALGSWPTSRGTGPLWDDTPIVGLIAMPLLIALSRFTDGPTRHVGMTAVGVVLVAMLARGLVQRLRAATHRRSRSGRSR